MKRQKDKNSIESYKGFFWRLTACHLPHRLLLAFALRYRLTFISSILSKSVERQLQKSIVKYFNNDDIDRYNDIAQSTKLWHGSGRLQYVDGSIKDIFVAILEGGSISPVSDSYAILFGGKETSSISTTCQRIIARSYADTHGKGMYEKNRYGTSLWWVSYYYSYLWLELMIKSGVLVVRNRTKWRNATMNQVGERLWGKKVNNNAKSVWSVFGAGSDIIHNYPIIFGIARHKNIVKLPSVLAKTEVRLTEPIDISDLSHIEVPANNVEEVKKILRKAGYATPVFSIELGEYIASRQGFAELIGLSE